MIVGLDGPTEPFFNQTWRPGDLEELNEGGGSSGGAPARPLTIEVPPIADEVIDRSTYWPAELLLAQ